MAYFSKPARFIEYPYRGLPPAFSHIAPLYAIWKAGPKLSLDDISQIAQRFCEGHVTENNPPAPDHYNEVKTRLELVAHIWQLVQDSKARAEAWKSSKRGKRRRSEDHSNSAPTSNTRTRSGRTRSSQTPAPSTRKSYSRASSRHNSSAVNSKGKGKGRGSNLQDAGVKETSLACGPGNDTLLTSEALHLHNQLLCTPLDNSVHPVQQWIAKVTTDVVKPRLAKVPRTATSVMKEPAAQVPYSHADQQWAAIPSGLQHAAYSNSMAGPPKRARTMSPRATWHSRPAAPRIPSSGGARIIQGRRHTTGATKRGQSQRPSIWRAWRVLAPTSQPSATS
jgi:hypothetical protein